MTDDRQEHSFDERLEDNDRAFDDLTLPATGSAEFVELQRLDESLSLLRDGQSPDLDRIEDPELASLLDVAAVVEEPLRTSTETRPFRSFRRRSRAAILHELEQDRLAAHEPRGGVVLAFLRRPIFAPAAAAAAAAALVIAVVATSGALPIIGQPGGSSQVVSNQTQQITAQELERISSALATIQDRTEKGESIPAPTFREVAESAARFANLIEREPNAVDREAVETFAQAMRTGQSVLEAARAEPEAEGALASAQRATRDGDVVASRLLSADEEEQLEEPVPTATPEPTPTATPEPTPTETLAPTPTPDSDAGDEADDDGADNGAGDAPAGEPTPAPDTDDTVTP